MAPVETPFPIHESPASWEPHGIPVTVFITQTWRGWLSPCGTCSALRVNPTGHPFEHRLSSFAKGQSLNDWTNPSLRRMHGFYYTFFSKAQLNWSAREKECYGFYYGVESDVHQYCPRGQGITLESLFPRQKFDFTYVKGKSLRQFVPDALSRLRENIISPQQLSAMLASLQPIVKIPSSYRSGAQLGSRSFGTDDLQEVTQQCVDFWQNDQSLHSTMSLLQGDEPVKSPH